MLSFRRRRAQGAQPTSPCPHRAALPAPLEGSDPARGLPGFYIAADAAAQAPAIVGKLEEIPNAQAAELLVYVESVNAVYGLAQELMRVDQELVRASNDELRSLLSEREHWERRTYSTYLSLAASSFRYRADLGYGPHHDRRWTEPEQVAQTRERVERWVDEHVPEAQLSAFRTLIDRRFELRQAARDGQEGLQRMAQEVRQAHHKSQIIAAAEQLDPTIGLVDPTQALAAVAGAQSALQVVNEAIDEAYRIAVVTHPELV